MPDPRLSYSQYLAALRGAAQTAQLWRLIVGGAVIVVLTLGLAMAFQTVIRLLAPHIWAMSYGSGFGDTPGSLFVLLGGFAFLGAATCITTSVIHRRNWRDLFGPFARPRPQFWRILVALLILSVVLWLLPPYGGDMDLVPNMELGTWLRLLPLSVLAVLIQTSAEEILFRGYLQQQLAARFSNPLN